MPSKIKLDVFRNAMVKNSLFVLVFVISYLALTGRFKPTLESFLDETQCEAAAQQYLKDNPDVKQAGFDAWTHYTRHGKQEGRKWNGELCAPAALPADIDKVMGYQGGPHDNIGGPNQTAESCRQLALKDPKYLAWGYRTQDHSQPEWKNTCFLYTNFGPYAGNTNDKEHQTGCLRAGEKVALGCKASPPTPLPDDIDRVYGWQGDHENPDLKNQTAESCRQAALKDSKYVAWGYRTNDHPDGIWKNTCFLYTNGFKPYAGNPDDKAHQTGCLRPGEKVALGCKAPATTSTSTTTVPSATTQATLPSDIDKVMGYQGGSIDNPGVLGQTEESCRQQALKDPKYLAWGYRTSDHWDPKEKNTCFLYTSFGPFAGNTSDKAHTTGCLRAGEKVALGCKAPATASSTPETTTTTVTSAVTCATDACNRIIKDYLAKGWAYTSSDFAECKGCPVVNYPNTLPTTSAPTTPAAVTPIATPSTTTPVSSTTSVASTATPSLTASTPTNDTIITTHIQILKFAWFVFLEVARKMASEIPFSLMAKVMVIWKASLKVVGFPTGLYDELGPTLYNLTDQTGLTFTTMVIPKEKVVALFDAFVKQNGAFIPADKQAYEQATVASAELMDMVAHMSVDPHSIFNPPTPMATATPQPTSTATPAIPQPTQDATATPPTVTPLVTPSVPAPTPVTAPSTPAVSSPTVQPPTTFAPKEGVVVSTPTFKLYDHSTTQSVPTQVFDKPSATVVEPPTAPKSVDEKKDTRTMFSVDEWVKDKLSNKSFWVIVAIVLVWMVVIGIVISYISSSGATVMSNTRYSM